MNSQQVVFTNRADAAFFYGETAALSVFGVIDTNLNFLRIAPVCIIDGVVSLDQSQALTVLPSDVEVLQ